MLFPTEVGSNEQTVMICNMWDSPRKELLFICGHVMSKQRARVPQG